MAQKGFAVGQCRSEDRDVNQAARGIVCYRGWRVCPLLSAPQILLAAVAHGLKVPRFSSGKRFLYTQSMSERAELFEAWVLWS
jgi:hypothetical protein